MKSQRDIITEQNKRAAGAGNGPDLIRRDEDVLFHRRGPSGWNRRHDLGDYKAGRSEHNFADQHHRFTEEEG